MKTKIVYVTTCNENNIYLEQVLMSAYTARLHNPDATIILVTDVESEKSICGSRNEIRKYVDEVKAIKCPDGFNNMKKSRYLKTNIRDFVEGDFIYIDSDTVICESLNELDDINDDICGVLDRHEVYKAERYPKDTAMFKKCGYDFGSEFSYINGGVFFVRDNKLTHEFFKAWYEGWLHTTELGYPMDMMSLHNAELKTGYKIKEISGIWNCQIEGACLNYLKDAKIIHYFSMGSRGSTSTYLLRDENLYHRIKKNGNIPADIIELLEHPHRAFTLEHRIVANQTLDYLRESSGLQKMYKYFHKPTTFVLGIFNFLSDLFMNNLGNILRKNIDK